MTEANWGGYQAAYAHESQGQFYRGAGQSPYVHPAHGGAGQPAAYGSGAQSYSAPPPYGYEAMPQGHEPMHAAPSTIGKVINGAGAVMSLALIVGLAVWGYKLAVRDVTGVPVVRALQGPMRIQPDDPGGLDAAHQGLAVNEVAAGEPDQLSDEVALAPAPMTLSEEDQPAVAMPAPETVAAAESGTVEADTAVDESALLAMVDSITDGVEPLSGALDTGAAEIAPPEVPVADARFDVIPTSVPGVTLSPRPQPRPAEIVARAATSPVDLALASAGAATAPAYQDIAIADVPSGTRLVQLGAFDSAEVAQQEWDRIMARFSEVFVGKDRVIGQAQSGGRTFYRLRAMNFTDLADARRFCAALRAGNAACIPVVSR